MKGGTDGKPEQPTFLTPGALAARDEFVSGRTDAIHELRFGAYHAQILPGQDSLWVIVKGKSGGFALRTAYSPGSSLRVKTVSATERSGEFEVIGAMGTFRVSVHAPDDSDTLLRCTTRLIPAENVTIPYWPRDLYPLDKKGDPMATGGNIEAAQRGLNSGVLFVKMEQPAFGSLLYFQNWTMLNDYFVATETTPDGCVGGDWPELGYEPPVSKEKALPAGKEIVVSDAFLNFSPVIPEGERQAARLFLDLLAGVYRHLERPASEFHSWPSLARETARDLENSPKATLTEYGYRYLYPYTESELPDSMSQLTVLLALCEFARWRGEDSPVANELRRGVPRFFDVGLNVLRRYLPSARSEKDLEEVDSWYLYHPMANLGRLASEGDEEAKSLFLQSLEYGIKVARHFEYKWPVQFKMSTLEVIKQERKDGDPGQSDAGGLYAYVMLQAYELTGEARFLQEAKSAIQALHSLEFELAYQMNITAWGASACLWLWRITGDDYYRDQSYVFLASFFHNTLLWNSQIKNATHYLNFLAVTCLHDGLYMAIYECYESYASFCEYLERGGDDLNESVKLLLTEYCKYALSRAWYYYPQNLPPEILATEIRNGEIDRLLAFPLEDLYADGQPAGQVGQEIYGCGAAFAFTTHAFLHLPNAPFLLYCEYPIYNLAAKKRREISFRTHGVVGFDCKTRLIPVKGEPLPPAFLRLTDSDGTPSEEVEGVLTEEGHCEFTIPANRLVIVRWGREREK